MILDIDTELSGDVSQAFAAYDYDANYGLLRRVYDTVSTQLPPGTLEILASYPDEQACVGVPPDPPDPPGSPDSPEAFGGGDLGCSAGLLSSGGGPYVLVPLLLGLWLAGSRRSQRRP